ncbi:MAG: molybdopterin molybdotransferase MoeA [Nitrospinae bacterium]|nr:molybdopterin molybdotransferase MoeA [Nitrospinota bacterium]
MILVEEALKIIADNIMQSASTGMVHLAEALGRTLAKDAVSDVDIPPFNRVTMDGYAVISPDGPGEYEVVEYVPAGAFPQIALTRGKVSKVMTGAPLPEGADGVIQVEKTGGYVDVGQKAKINASAKQWTNVARRGEDVAKGDTVLKSGAVIGFAQMAALAAVGADPVEVRGLPSVAVLATGDELVAPSVKPGPGQIRNSNTYSLCAQVKGLGITPVILGIAKDNEEDLAAKAAKGREHDFLLISGGVSEGDRDFVPKVLERAGYKILVHHVRVRPGKPMLFAVADGPRYAFGLPGNPVSTAVIFELFIKGALRRFSGAPALPAPMIKAVLDKEFKRKNAEREEYVPVSLAWEGERLAARRISYHGSGHFHALSGANGLIKIPIGVSEVAAGSNVDARFFDL